MAMGHDCIASAATQRIAAEPLKQYSNRHIGKAVYVADWFLSHSKEALRIDTFAMAASGMMCNLSGKVALITGASSGIGAATAVLFARLGAKLAITGRNESNLQEVSKSCSQHLAAEQERPLLLIGDLTSEQDVQRISREDSGKIRSTRHTG
jgi:hypothetical protein